MIRQLLVSIMILALATGVMAQGFDGMAMQSQPEAKRIDSMTIEELSLASKQIEETAAQLEAVTKSTLNLIDNIMNTLRGKKSVIVEDNNKLMIQLRSQKDAIRAQLNKLLSEKAEKDKKDKESKSGNWKR